MPIEADLGRQHVIEQLLQWTDEARIEAIGLEEQLQVIERILQDVNDETLSDTFYLRLGWWFHLLRNFDPSVATVPLRGLQMRLQYIVNLLADSYGLLSQGTTALDQVLAIPPRLPPDWRREGPASGTYNSLLLLGWTPLPASAAAVDDQQLLFLRRILASKRDALAAAESTVNEVASPYRQDAGVMLVPVLFLGLETVPRVWTIDLHFHGEHERRLSDVAETLRIVAAALESVEGVTVFISDVRSGSIWTRLRVVMRDKATRDKVQEILEKTRDGLIAKELDSHIASTDRDRSEADKLKEEAETLRAARDTLHRGDEAERIRLLEIERLELENLAKRAQIERQQIENSILRLQVVEKASELMKQGLLGSAPLEIGINGQGFVYVLKDGSSALDSMEAIVEGETLLLEPLLESQTKD